MRKIIFILIACVVISGGLSAQTEVEWGGLIYFYNFFHSNTDFSSLTDDGNNYMYIHGDIQANVKFGRGLSSYVVVGAWGQHGMSPYYGGGLGENVDPGVRLLQVYFTLDNLFDAPLSLRIGKQRLLYGDGAVLFDGGEDGAIGLKATYLSDFIDVDAFIFRPCQFGGIALVGSGLDIYPDNWNVLGLYPTIKLADGKFNISPYFVTRRVRLGENDYDSPLWLGGRIEGSPLDNLKLVGEYVMMGGKDESSDTDYKGSHIRLGADYNFDALGVGGYFVVNSGNDGTTNDNERYESALHGPYTNGFYKDWPGFGPAHLMTTGFGFSGLAPHNGTVVNLNVINGHVGFTTGAITLRGDFFIYNRNWVPSGAAKELGNEIALLVKYNYRDVMTFGFTGGMWVPGDHINNRIEAMNPSAKAENALGGYIWFAKSF